MHLPSFRHNAPRATWCWHHTTAAAGSLCSGRGMGSTRDAPLARLRLKGGAAKDRSDRAHYDPTSGASTQGQESYFALCSQDNRRLLLVTKSHGLVLRSTQPPASRDSLLPALAAWAPPAEPSQPGTRLFLWPSSFIKAGASQGSTPEAPLFWLYTYSLCHQYPNF